MRLIDADELVKNILSQTIMDEQDAKVMDRYLYCIKNQPTAYDIDKVVEELEKLKAEKEMGTSKVVVKECIEIVKQGVR